MAHPTPTMPTPRTIILVALAFGASFASLSAQPASATFHPSLLDSVSAGFSSSAKGNLQRGGATIGDVAVTRFEFSLSGRVPLSRTMMFVPGLAYERTSLDAAAGTPLPGSLQVAALSLGVKGQLSAEWAWGGFLRPGFYGDFKHLGGDSFNAPLFLGAFYTPQADVTWTLGLSLNAFNDNPVLPAAGVHWTLAPDWDLDVGFPRTGVTYRMSSALALRAGFTVAGGAYRITDNLGVPAPGVARLANTYLDYTEVRAGVGLSYNVEGGLNLELGAGLTVLRRFEYPDRNFRLNGDNVGWVSLALDRRF